MNLKVLCNRVLHEKVVEIAKREKELLMEAVLHIAEVERRKMYRAMGVASLYDYMTKRAGFSHGSAYRLMDAARLQLQAPELAKKLGAGQITMAQVRLVQEASRESQKQDSKKAESLSLFSFAAETTAGEAEASGTIETPAPEMKGQLLESLQGLTAADSEKIVAKSFGLKPKKKQKIKTQKDGSVLVEATFSAEEWEWVQQARALLSNAVPTCGVSETIAAAAKKYVEDFAKPARPRPTTKTLTRAKKKFVKQRDGCCQFRDPVTGELCGRKFHLQVDHIQSRWAGGSHAIENLQALCAAHNRLKYQMESRIRPC